MGFSEKSNLGSKRYAIRVKLPNTIGNKRFSLYLGKDTPNIDVEMIEGRLCKSQVYIKADDIQTICVGSGMSAGGMYEPTKRLFIVLGEPEIAGDGGRPLILDINFYTFASLKMLNNLAWLISASVPAGGEPVPNYDLTKNIKVVPNIDKSNPKNNGYSVYTQSDFCPMLYSWDDLSRMGVTKNDDKRDRNNKRDDLIDKLFELVSTSKELTDVYDYNNEAIPESSPDDHAWTSEQPAITKSNSFGYSLEVPPEVAAQMEMIGANPIDDEPMF